MTKKVLHNIGKALVIAILLILIALGMLFGYLMGSMLEICRNAPEINPKSILSELNENSYIVDRDGRLVEKIETEEYRQIISIDEMPKYLKEAFIAVEDERFETHNGVDPQGVIKSVLDNLVSGDIVRGGSTITQQLVKNVYLSEEQKWERKITEMYLALQVDEELTKDQILEAYLNRVFFGQNAYGVQAAAQTYFSKNAKDLTLSEAATLAGVVQAPSRFSLFYTARPTEVEPTDEVVGQINIYGENWTCIYNDKPVARRNYVLKKMLELGKISQAQYDDAIDDDLRAQLKPGQRGVQNISSFFTDLVKEQAIDILMDVKDCDRKQARSLLYNGGLTITSTVDIELQKKLEDLFTNFTEILYGDTSDNSRPPGLDLDLDVNGNIVNSNGRIVFLHMDNLLEPNHALRLVDSDFDWADDGSLILYPNKMEIYKDYINIMDCFTLDEKDKSLITHRVGTIAFDENDFVKNEDGSATIKKEFLDKNPDFVKKVGDQIHISQKYFYVDVEGVAQPQAATVVLDNKTGTVAAIVGGRERADRKSLNRAAWTPRQPGSSFKPIAVYVPALDNGYSLASAIDDVPVRVIDDEVWPRNENGAYLGLMTMRKAIIRSTNAVAVRTLEQIGIDTSLNYLKRFGIIDEDHPDQDTFIQRSENPNTNDENLSMALGALTDGITPLKMAEAYHALANKGKHVKAMAIEKITTSRGEVLYENKKESNTVVSPQVAYEITNAMEDVANASYNSAARVEGISTAGKTGTTNDNADFWFCGYSPYYTISVWIGCDNQQISMVGSSVTAVNLWGPIADVVHEGKEPAKFERPDGIVEQTVCSMSGKLVTENCKRDSRGTIITEIFDQKNLPTEECDVHVLRTVDKRNNLLAVPETPAIYKEDHVFIKRPHTYIPKDFKDVVPKDWVYEVPTKYSDLPTVLPPPETVTNEDGSVTVTTYNADGTISKVTTFVSGYVETTIIKPDGTRETTVTPPDPNTPKDPANPENPQDPQKPSVPEEGESHEEPALPDNPPEQEQPPSDNDD